MTTLLPDGDGGYTLVKDGRYQGHFMELPTALHALRCALHEEFNAQLQETLAVMGVD